MRAMLAAVVLSGAMVGAAAGTIQGDAQRCGYLTQSSQLLYITSAFDNRKWEEVQPEILEAVQKNKGQADSYIVDDADAAYVMRVFERVWKAQTDEGLAERIYRECLKPMI